MVPKEGDVKAVVKLLRAKCPDCEVVAAGDVFLHGAPARRGRDRGNGGTGTNPACPRPERNEERRGTFAWPLEREWMGLWEG